MVFDGLQCFQKPELAGKCPVLSQRVAGPTGAFITSTYIFNKFNYYDGVYPLCDESMRRVFTGALIATKRTYLN